MFWALADQRIELLTVAAEGLSAPAAIYSGRAWLCGWIIAHPGTAQATEVTIRDGADTNGRLIALVEVPAGVTATIGPALPGIPVESGLWLDPGGHTISATFVLGVE